MREHACTLTSGHDGPHACCLPECPEPPTPPPGPGQEREERLVTMIWNAAKQALEHQMHRTHKHSPVSCDGCADADVFVATLPNEWRAALEHP
jgi:hypothetical protein